MNEERKMKKGKARKKRKRIRRRRKRKRRKAGRKLITLTRNHITIPVVAMNNAMTRMIG